MTIVKKTRTNPYNGRKIIYYQNKVDCDCGGSYSMAEYGGSYGNCDNKTSHEATKIHQNYLKTGVMSEKTKQKKLRAAIVEEKRVEDALAEKRLGQILCGCGSWYNPKHTHLATEKHAKWVRKNEKKLLPSL